MLLTPLAFLSFEKRWLSGIQTVNDDLVFVLAMFEEPFNFIFIS